MLFEDLTAFNSLWGLMSPFYTQILRIDWHLVRKINTDSDEILCHRQIKGHNWEEHFTVQNIDL